MAYAIKPLTKTKTAGILADLIFEAFTSLEYTKPRDSTYSQQYLPENIYDSKSAEEKCNAALILNVTGAVSNLRDLSSQNDVNDFQAKYNEFNYTLFIDEMIKYEANFETCTSYYSTFINRLVALASNFSATASKTISFGATYVFEKETQVYYHSFFGLGGNVWMVMPLPFHWM